MFDLMKSTLLRSHQEAYSDTSLSFNRRRIYLQCQFHCKSGENNVQYVLFKKQHMAML